MQYLNSKLLDKFTYLMGVKKYAGNSIRSYESLLKLFFVWIKKQSKDISINDFESYLLHLHNINKLSYSYHSQIVGAWKLYLNLTHNKSLKYNYKYKPRKSKKLIEVLSMEEVGLIINSIKHPKQKAIISGIAYHGLRISEILNLKYSDINRFRNLLFIRESKGMKDRFTPLHSKWVDHLKLFARFANHGKYYDGYIFRPYSTSSISNILKSHALNVGIKNNVYPHLLRHSFATQLVLQGIDSSFIKEIMGHDDIRTVLQYEHISAKNISEVILKVA